MRLESNFQKVIVGLNVTEKKRDCHPIHPKKDFTCLFGYFFDSFSFFCFISVTERSNGIRKTPLT